jgi:hypothetical protein
MGMKDIYTKQLRLVLQQYRRKLSEIKELDSKYRNVERNSKDSVYKDINLQEIKNRLAELNG